MKKSLIIFLLFYSCIIQYVHSHELINNAEYCMIEKSIKNSPKTICYNCGNVTVMIYNTNCDTDTICNVIISSRSICLTTTCDKTPILEWAFKDMTMELKKCQYTISNIYNPFYYQLSLIQGDSETIVASSSIKYADNKSYTTKIDELIKFLNNLWYAHFVKDKDRGQK